MDCRCVCLGNGEDRITAPDGSTWLYDCHHVSGPTRQPPPGVGQQYLLETLGGDE